MTTLGGMQPGMHTMSMGGPTTPMLNYGNLMMIARNLQTGNMVLDMILMTLASSLITLFMGGLSFKNLRWFFVDVIWNNLVWLFTRKKVKVKEDPKVKLYKVIIRYEYKSKGNTSGPLDSDDTFVIDNKVYFESIFNFLSERPGNMDYGELAVKFHGFHDYDYSRYRDYSKLMKPLNDVEIDGLKLSLKEEIEQPTPPPPEECEEDEEGNPIPKRKRKIVQKKGDLESTTTFRKQITVTSEKTIPEILKVLDEIYQKYLDEKFPKPKPVKRQVMVEPRHYYVKEGWKNEFRRWELESRVTFDHIFFPGKEKFLRRVNKFMKKEIPLSKFTILLHGKPGGGKTSFIKALHNYTQCNVITLKLSQFDSIKDLMRVFHDSVIVCNEGRGNGDLARYQKYRVPINKRIYLFEDIDAADKIVLQRDKKTDAERALDRKIAIAKKENAKKAAKEKKEKAREKKKLQRQKNMLEINLMKIEADADLDESKKREKICEFETKIAEIDDKLDDINSDDEASDSEDDDDPTVTKKDDDVSIFDDFWGEYGHKAKGYSYDSPLALKLADILNLLDGVLELPGCFVVMTTNFKNKLDEALIRPGRVSYDLELGEIQRPQMLEMLEKFIPKYKDELPRRMSAELIKDLQYPPPHQEIDDSSAEPENIQEEQTVGYFLDHYISLYEEDPVMPCRFESFCINEDNLLDTISNMDDYLEIRNRDRQKKKRELEELAKLESIGITKDSSKVIPLPPPPPYTKGIKHSVYRNGLKVHQEMM